MQSQDQSTKLPLLKVAFEKHSECTMAEYCIKTTATVSLNSREMAIERSWKEATSRAIDSFWNPFTYIRKKKVTPNDEKQLQPDDSIKTSHFLRRRICFFSYSELFYVIINTNTDCLSQRLHFFLVCFCCPCLPIRILWNRTWNVFQPIRLHSCYSCIHFLYVRQWWYQTTMCLKPFPISHLSLRNYLIKFRFDSLQTFLLFICWWFL